MSQRITPTRGNDQTKIDLHDPFNWSADQCCFSFHRTVVFHVLVTDLIEILILFYMILQLPERAHVHSFGVYMAPRPSHQCVRISGQISPITSHRGMGPVEWSRKFDTHFK